MYRWEPEGGFHDAVWSGTLTVDGACVYLDVSHQNGAELAPGDEPPRIFVRLPEPLTRFSAATGKLWVGGDGPMSTGDEVVLVGSEGWPGDGITDDDGLYVFSSNTWTSITDITEPCRAHTSFWAASMRPAGDGPAGGPPLAELPGLGLYAWDPGIPNPEGSGDLGRLIIEEPCVYFERAAPTVDETGLARFFLHLPRPLVRFDPDTGSLSFGGYGPLASGDKVIMRVGYPISTDHLGEFLEAGCSAGGEFSEREYWGVLMEPCDSPSKFAWCAD